MSKKKTKYLLDLDYLYFKENQIINQTPGHQNVSDIVDQVVNNVLFVNRNLYS